MRHRLLLIGFLWTLSLAVAAGQAAGDPAPNAGFLYGTVTLDDGGKLTGYLRWEDEEAFWDDLFHSRQRDVKWDDYADMEALAKARRQEYYRNHGLIDRIAYALENRDGERELRRLFVARFGDVAAIRVDADEAIALEMNEGTLYPVRGHSNDVSQDIIVTTADGETHDLDWDEFREIRFAQAPADLAPPAARLWGHVRSREGSYEGFIQWDKSECVDTDILDSDEEDLAMGDLAELRRVPGGNSEATLRDGRVLALSGSNDVGNGNRGVVVETTDRGRLTIPWDLFESAAFATGHGSGPGRDAYAGDGPLRGAVTDADGRTWRGRLVFDLDEARTGDLFNGNSAMGTAYDIPFRLIATIEPTAPAAVRVGLRNGIVLDLQGEQDTGDGNAGVLVWETPDAAPRHILWSDVRRIGFEPFVID
ncbi:hypothetical protein KDM41_07785 [bacterium]|nr:hypothetical protein [bacterium]